MSPQSIILAGAGHVHAALMPAVRRWVAAGHRVTLIAPEAFVYSGMGTGVLAGHYAPSDNRFDVHAAFGQAGAHGHRCRVLRVDPVAKTVFADDGSAYGYDWLSLNLGSRVPLEAVADPAGRVVPAKPVGRLAGLRERLIHRIDEQDTLELAVIGGGVAGVEIAACLRGLCRRAGAADAAIHLIAGQAGLLPGTRSRLRRKAVQVLRGLEITVLRATAKEVTPGAVVLDDGSAIPAGTAVVAALGVRPIVPEGLPAAAQGGVPVTDSLQVKGHPQIFAVGDGAAWEPPLDRVGVYAVRQTPILAANLDAALAGKPLRSFRPQRHSLQILNLGDGTGLLAWRGLVMRSRWALWLKDRLDRTFINRLLSR